MHTSAYVECTWRRFRRSPFVSRRKPICLRSSQTWCALLFLGPSIDYYGRHKDYRLRSAFFVCAKCSPRLRRLRSSIAVCILYSYCVSQRASERAALLQDLHQQLHAIWKDIEVRKGESLDTK